MSALSTPTLTAVNAKIIEMCGLEPGTFVANGPMWIGCHMFDAMPEWLTATMDGIPRYAPLVDLPYTIQVSTGGADFDERTRLWAEQVCWVVETLTGRWCSNRLEHFHFGDESDLALFRLRFG